MSEVGRLLAKGRDADIFEFGNDLVLRRSRRGVSQVREAQVLHYAKEQGLPVPVVMDIVEDGRALVMERINGPTMVEAASKRPWKIGAFGTTLSQLHDAVHKVEAPEFLSAAPVGTGTSLLHLDLHPLNVMLSSRGPIIIDWTNASAGDPNVDVALTWALLAAGQLSGGLIERGLATFGRSILLHSFLAGRNLDDLRPTLNEVVLWKVRDPNLSAAECSKMLDLL